MSRTTVKFLIWLAIALVLIGWFLHRLEWQAVRDSFRQMNGGLILVAMCPIALTYLVRSLRWRVFLAPIGTTSVRNLFAANVVGYSAIFLVGRVGEAVRPVILSLREHIRPSATVATLLVERLSDMVTVGVIFALNLIVWSEPKTADPHSWHALKTTGLTLLLVALAGVWGLSIFRRRAAGVLTFVQGHLGWLPTPLRVIVLHLLGHLAEGLYVLHDLRGLAATLGYTLLVWGLVVISFFCVGLAFGLKLSLGSILFVLGFAMMGSLVPTPGGSAGAFHTATMAGLMLVGVEKNLAASVAIMLHIVSFGTAVLFGPYFLIRDGLSLGRLRRLVESEFHVPESRRAARMAKRADQPVRQDVTPCV